MAELITVETNFGDLARELRRIVPEAAKEMRKQLLLIAKDVAMETRGKLPSGMKSPQGKHPSGKRAASDITWSYASTKGAMVTAKSWAGAYDGGRSNATFKHPVYAPIGSPEYEDKASWPSQPTKHILEDTWEERKTWAVLKSEEAIDRAVRSAGFQEW